MSSSLVRSQVGPQSLRQPHVRNAGRRRVEVAAKNSQKNQGLYFEYEPVDPDAAKQLPIERGVGLRTIATRGCNPMYAYGDAWTLSMHEAKSALLVWAIAVGTAGHPSLRQSGSACIA
jgi:hypothetical protein